MKKVFNLIKFTAMFATIMLVNLLIQCLLSFGQFLNFDQYNWLGWFLQGITILISLGLTVWWYENKTVS